MRSSNSTNYSEPDFKCACTLYQHWTNSFKLDLLAWTNGNPRRVIPRWRSTFGASLLSRGSWHRKKTSGQSLKAIGNFSSVRFAKLWIPKYLKVDFRNGNSVNSNDLHARMLKRSLARIHLSLVSVNLESIRKTLCLHLFLYFNAEYACIEKVTFKLKSKAHSSI